MRFSEIVTLENPYEQLSDGDSLAENAQLLDALSVDEKNILATKIIASCPESKFKQYRYQLEALRVPNKTEGTFHSVIAEAYQVRQIIFALLDPRNQNPHRLFGEEFNPVPFQRFSDLALQLLKSNEPAIAERLALCTPQETRSDISRNMNIAFPRSILASRVQVAFNLRNNIETLLLGDHPEQFFTSRDYNKETCKTFMNMFWVLLKDRIEQIGTKLATIESDALRENIKRELALMHTEIFDETNPFKLIADVMVAQEGSLEKEKTTNPYGLFATQTSKKFTDRASSNDEMEEKDDENSPLLYSVK